MKRRKFIRNSLVGAGVLSAGCSETTPSGSINRTTSSATPTETVGEGSDSVSLDLPVPSERNYDEISYDIDLPENIDSILGEIERSIDLVVFDGRVDGVIPEEVQRSESYLSVETLGSASYENGVGETVEADLFGVETDILVEGDITNQEVITTASYMIPIFGRYSGDIYEEADASGNPEDHIPLDGESGISQFSLEFEADNITGNVTYSSGAEENSIEDYWTMLGEYHENSREREILTSELENDISFN